MVPDFPEETAKKHGTYFQVSWASVYTPVAGFHGVAILLTGPWASHTLHTREAATQRASSTPATLRPARPETQMTGWVKWLPRSINEWLKSTQLEAIILLLSKSGRISHPKVWLGFVFTRVFWNLTGFTKRAHTTRALQSLLPRQALLMLRPLVRSFVRPEALIESPKMGFLEGTPRSIQASYYAATKDTFCWHQNFDLSFCLPEMEVQNT